MKHLLKKYLPTRKEFAAMATPPMFLGVDEEFKAWQETGVPPTPKVQQFVSPGAALGTGSGTGWLKDGLAEVRRKSKI